MLRLIKTQKEHTELLDKKLYGAAADKHHRMLLEGFLQSHRIRNHSPKTIAETRRLLNGWFESHGTESRPLYTWEAMEPVTGRKRVVSYGKALLEMELGNSTIRKYLGILAGYFSYVIEHPYVFDGETPRRIVDVYHTIDQPVSEYDIPQHGYDGEQLGIPLEPERLYDFYGILREKYIPQAKCRHIAARNYAMAVLAGETGLRADELVHIEINKDLFFESKRLQTRYAKGTNGSGKRARPTLFTPLARDTLQFYIKNHRHHLKGATDTDYLFPSKTGKVLTYTPMHNVLSKTMIPLARKNDLPIMDHFCWHWFRRIFATRFIERFPSRMDVLIQLLGHTSLATVHAYICHSKAWQDKRIQETLEGVNLDGDSMEI